MPVDEQFERTRLLFGDDAMERLAKSKVAVFGIGGVGGHAVEVLARSGVGELHLIDNDTVSVTNLNRQLIALHSTLGLPKVEAARLRILDINPQCKVVTHQLFYLPENADGFSLDGFDYVADCIDTVAAKVCLVSRCHDLHVPIISSMGAANKIDATAFRVTDISKTKNDPLAKVVRKKLRELGIFKLKVVFSEELPVKAFAQEQGSSRRIPASNAYVPAVAGLIVGGEVVKDIAGV